MSSAGLEPGRNDPCPCGSGKKFKRCCMSGPPARGAAASADAWAEGMRVARGRLDAGDLAGAKRAYGAILTAYPGAHVARAALAQVHATEGAWEEAELGMRRAIAGDPRVAKYHVGLATALLNRGRLEESIAATRRAFALDPREVTASCVAALALERAHRHEEALAAIRPALVHAPDHVDANIILGRLERRAGDLAPARARLLRVVTREPAPTQVARAWHELAAVHEALGDFRDAYDAYDRAGRAEDRGPVAAGLDRLAWPRAIAEARGAVEAGVLDRPPVVRPDPGAPPPAFLVGFPRSGTTMTEQVLAAHPGVLTTDETPLVRALDTALRARVPGATLAERLAALGADDAAALRAAYRDDVAALLPGAADGRLVVDKLPLNLVHLVLLDVLFPEARVIVALRDPRDACLSCFVQQFQLNDAMVNFLTLRRTIDFYAAVMGLWLEIRDRLRIRWIEIRYEDTIEDLEAQARRILDLLGLPWDPAVLDFHERARERYIATPSYEAVTEPVHRRRIDRWRKYAFAFEPLAEPLAPFLRAFGYA